MYGYIQTYVESLLEQVRHHFMGAGTALQVLRKNAANNNLEWHTPADAIVTVGTGGDYSLLSDVPTSVTEVNLISDVAETAALTISHAIAINFKGFEISNTHEITISQDDFTLNNAIFDADLIINGNYCNILNLRNGQKLTIHTGTHCRVGFSKIEGDFTVGTAAIKASLIANVTANSVIDTNNNATILAPSIL